MNQLSVTRNERYLFDVRIWTGEDKLASVLFKGVTGPRAVDFVKRIEFTGPVHYLYSKNNSPYYIYENMEDFIKAITHKHRLPRLKK